MNAWRAWGLMFVAAVGVVGWNGPPRPTPAPRREISVHFWHVPELDHALVRTVGWSVQWEYGQRHPRTSWEKGDAPCVVCRQHNRQEAWNCAESNPIWPTHDGKPGGGWCRKAQWLGQVPIEQWRAGVLGKRSQPAVVKKPRGRMFELVDILEARPAPPTPNPLTP